MHSQIPIEKFAEIGMYVGTIVHAEAFPEARKPAYILTLDFGKLGMRKSSAQVTEQYALHTLIGRQIVALLNIAPKQIGPFQSECLVLAAVHENGLQLIAPDATVPNGSRIA